MKYCDEHCVLKNYDVGILKGCRDMDDGVPLEPPPENSCIFAYNKSYCLLDSSHYGALAYKWEEDK